MNKQLPINIKYTEMLASWIIPPPEKSMQMGKKSNLFLLVQHTANSKIQLKVSAINTFWTQSCLLLNEAIGLSKSILGMTGTHWK